MISQSVEESGCLRKLATLGVVGRHRTRNIDWELDLRRYFANGVRELTPTIGTEANRESRLKQLLEGARSGDDRGDFGG